MTPIQFIFLGIVVHFSSTSSSDSVGEKLNNLGKKCDVILSLTQLERQSRLKLIEELQNIEHHLNSANCTSSQVTSRTDPTGVHAVFHPANLNFSLQNLRNGLAAEKLRYAEIERLLLDIKGTVVSCASGMMVSAKNNLYEMLKQNTDAIDVNRQRLDTLDQMMATMRGDVRNIQNAVKSSSECSLSETCGWQLVFRADKGVSGNILAKWESTSTFNEDKSTAKMLNSSFTGVYKSSMVEQWEQQIIDQIKLAVYEGGDEKAYFIFNGLGSTKNDWFTKSRLLASSYTDLKESQSNFFSIKGDQRYGRTFFISKSYGGCGNDHAWFMVADEGPVVCSYMTGEHNPYFLYCPNGRECNMREALVASKFAVFVRTKPL